METKQLDLYVVQWYSTDNGLEWDTIVASSSEEAEKEMLKTQMELLGFENEDIEHYFSDAEAFLVAHCGNYKVTVTLEEDE